MEERVESQEGEELEGEGQARDPKEKFKSIVDQFDEMITFMDFSFEKAFEKKEKDFKPISFSPLLRHASA